MAIQRNFFEPLSSAELASVFHIPSSLGLSNGPAVLLSLRFQLLHEEIRDSMGSTTKLGYTHMHLISSSRLDSPSTRSYGLGRPHAIAAIKLQDEKHRHNLRWWYLTRPWECHGSEFFVLARSRFSSIFIISAGTLDFDSIKFRHCKVCS